MSFLKILTTEYLDFSRRFWLRVNINQCFHSKRVPCGKRSFKVLLSLLNMLIASLLSVTFDHLQRRLRNPIVFAAIFTNFYIKSSIGESITIVYIRKFCKTYQNITRFRFRTAKAQPMTFLCTKNQTNKLLAANNRSFLYIATVRL